MYNPKIWYTGDIVSSGGLNNMEQGIAQNAHDIETINDSIEDLSTDTTELKREITDKSDTADMLKAFPADTASGSVASFADGANVPVKSLVVDIDPGQSGSGDPSPTNIRPISGWTAAKVTRTGKNLCYETRLSGPANILFFIDKPVSNTITLSATINVATSSNSIYLNVDGTSKGAVGLITGSAGEKQTQTLTLSDTQMEIIKNGSKVCLLLYKGGADFTLPTDAQVELGSTATSYEPYSGQSINIQLGQTVYGGKLDVVSGVLTTYPYYASYNGETLTGAWISDRDKYVDGATPTTGAQVVNIGGAGTDVQLEPHEVRSLLGDNNVWADTGDSTVEYRADPTLYVQRKISEAISALS